MARSPHIRQFYVNGVVRPCERSLFYPYTGLARRVKVSRPASGFIGSAAKHSFPLIQAIIERRHRGRLPVAISFDDGNASDALIALPELTKRNLQAIFFVVGARVGLPHYLDRIAVRDLAAAGMEVEIPYHARSDYSGASTVSRSHSV